MTWNELCARVKQKWISRLQSAKKTAIKHWPQWCLQTTKANNGSRSWLSMFAHLFLMINFSNRIFCFDDPGHECVERGRQAAYLSSRWEVKIIFWRNISVRNIIEEVFLALSLTCVLHDAIIKQWRQRNAPKSMKRRWTVCVCQRQTDKMMEASLARVTLLTGVSRCVLLRKANRAGCATTFVSAQRAVMLLLLLFFLWSKWRREREKKKSERERECIRLCWSRRRGI